MSDDDPLGMEQAWADLLTTEAAARHQLHVNHTSRRPLSEGYDLVGLAGEVQFGREYRQPLNLLTGTVGDPGYDFVIPLRFTVDVKTFRRPHHLIQEQGKVTADIYVLAGFTDEPARAHMLGWEYGRVLERAPLRDFGYGIITHHIPVEALRPMRELAERIMHLR